MAVPIPQTLDQADAAGGKPFRGSDEEEAAYGAPIQLWPRAGASSGDICAAFICLDGWRLVRYRDGGLGCTETYLVPCTD